MTVGHDGNTSYGTTVETIAAQLTELGADVVGLNCSVGPAAMLDAIERMAGAHRPAALGPAERRTAPGGGRPADLSRQPRVHGAPMPGG